MTLNELKVKAYDLMAQIEFCQRELQQVHQQMSQVIEEEKKPKEEKK